MVLVDCCSIEDKATFDCWRDSSSILPINRHTP
jgi:hypothetical protein